MKILRVISSMIPSQGGPCQGLRNIIPELERRGIYNEVISLDDPKSYCVDQDSFNVTPLGPAKGVWRFSGELLPWLQTNLHRFDVVVIHGLWSYYGFAVRKALQRLNDQGKKKVPLLYYMPHGMLDPYFQRAPGRRLKAIRNWFYWTFIESKLINQADGALFTCEEELLLARQTFSSYKPKAEFYIGYGISEPPMFTEKMQEEFLTLCPEAAKRPILLFLSRVHQKKGVDLLIVAYKNLFDSIAETDRDKFPALVIAGPGLETSYGKELVALAQSNVNSQVPIYFTGMLEGNAKWGAFYLSQAFILSSHQENFGISIVEALACSKPVLISNKVNIWREIKAGQGGLVENDTLEGTQAMLQQWLNLSTSEKEVMSSNARIVYEKHFTNGSAADRFTNTLNIKSTTFAN